MPSIRGSTFKWTNWIWCSSCFGHCLPFRACVGQFVFLLSIQFICFEDFCLQKSNAFELWTLKGNQRPNLVSVFCIIEIGIIQISDINRINRICLRRRDFYRMITQAQTHFRTLHLSSIAIISWLASFLFDQFNVIYCCQRHHHHYLSFILFSNIPKTNRCIHITDIGVGYISTMLSLTALFIRWCSQVRDFGLQHLCSMRNLQILSLAG